MMKITKIKKTTYELVSCEPGNLFGTLSHYIQLRQKHNLSYQKNCFNCGHHFLDDEPIYLATFTKCGNKFLCGKCREIALKDLKAKMNERDNIQS